MTTAEGPSDTITYLDRETVRALLPDPLEQMDRLAEVYRAMAGGRVENPPKIGVHPRPSTFLQGLRPHLRPDPDLLADGRRGARAPGGFFRREEAA